MAQSASKYVRLRILVALAALAAPTGGCGPDEAPGTLGTIAGPLQARCTARVAGKGDKEIEGDYLAHVVCCENGGAPLEALKAQAVAARSFLYYKLETTGSIEDSQNDQAYSCDAKPGPIHFQAVSETAGEVLRYEGAQVAAFYVAGATPKASTCIAGESDFDPTGTEKWVTYNEGKSGAAVLQTPLGLVDPANHANRGCKSQNGARCLAEHGSTYQEILRFYYGADIAIVKAEGPCTDGAVDPPTEGPVYRDIALRPDGDSGFTLDGTGALHPFGGAPAIADGPSWPGEDMARAVALRSDGASGYVLDRSGGVHPFGGAPAVPGTFIDASGDRARALALRSDDRSGWVLDSEGRLHPFGGAPEATPGATFSVDIARDLALAGDGASGWVLDGWGGVHPFGGAAPLPQGPDFGGDDRARALLVSFDGRSGYVVDALGDVHPFGDALPVLQAPAWESKRGRAAALRRDATGGRVLDDEGGVHPFVAEPGARALVVRGDGSGWIMDAPGRLSAFGGAPEQADDAPFAESAAGVDAALIGDDSGYRLSRTGALAPFGDAPSLLLEPLFGEASPGRALALRADGSTGYVLLGTGALAPFGGAPDILPESLWPTDMARGVALRSNGSSGFILDAHGGLHPFGDAPPWTGDTAAGTSARAIALFVDDSGGYVLTGDGAVRLFGAAPEPATPPLWPGWDVARDIALLPDGGALILDVHGFVHAVAATTSQPGEPEDAGADVAVEDAGEVAEDAASHDDADGSETTDSSAAPPEYGRAARDGAGCSVAPESPGLPWLLMLGALLVTIRRRKAGERTVRGR